MNFQRLLDDPTACAQFAQTFCETYGYQLFMAYEGGPRHHNDVRWVDRMSRRMIKDRDGAIHLTPKAFFAKHGDMPFFVKDGVSYTIQQALDAVGWEFRAQQ